MNYFLNFITCCCVWLIVQSVWAQDTIVKSGGEIISAKILEVHTDEIHYKKYNNPDGPVYILAASDIQKIKYENGFIEVYGQDDAVKKQPERVKQLEEKSKEEIEVWGNSFYYQNRRIGQTKLKELIARQGNKEAIEMYEKAKYTQVVAHLMGYASIPVGAVTYIFMLDGALLVGTQASGIIALSGFAVFHALQIGNYVYRSVYKNKRKAAVELYNQALRQSTEHSTDDYY